MHVSSLPKAVTWKQTGRDSNPPPFGSRANTQPLRHTGHPIQLQMRMLCNYMTEKLLCTLTRYKIHITLPTPAKQRHSHLADTSTLSMCYIFSFILRAFFP